MRAWAIALVVVLASSPALVRAQPKGVPAAPKGNADDMARARALDQQGAKAYSEGRYNDAIRYFEEAYRLGGPAFEQWNIAKCHLRLDQPEQAADMLEKYLSTPNLPPEDRAEAQEQLDELKKRPSTLTVSSSPAGASVTVDGKPAPGKTPVSITVGPGSHAVAVSTPKYGTYNKQIEAKYGRAIILDAPLESDESRKLYGAGSRWAVSAFLGVDIPKHGTVSGTAEPGGILTGTFRFANVGPTAFAVGGAVLLTGDSWSNSVNAPTTIAGCPSLRDGQSATAMSLFGIVTAGWELAPKFRAHVVGGGGAALYFPGGVEGGDLFVPNCNAGTSVRPALFGAAQLDYNVTPMFRISALPIAMQFHGAFDNARPAPVDASGLWYRAVIAIGAGVDF